MYPTFFNSASWGSTAYSQLLGDGLYLFLILLCPDSIGGQLALLIGYTGICNVSVDGPDLSIVLFCEVLQDIGPGFASP
jgi:hypothetical protein